MISRSPRCTTGRRRAAGGGASGRRPAARDGAAAAAARRRRFDPQRAEPGERFAQASRRFRRPEAADRAPGPSTAIRRRCRRVSAERTAAATAPDRVLEHDGDDGRHGSAGFANEPDGDAAKGRDRHIQRHAHAAHRPPQHHALAVQIDNAPALIGRFVGGFKTHGQGEGVEPRAAARPGSEPAGFHLTPRNFRLPPGCCRPVAPNLPQRRRNRLKNPG